MRYFTPPSQAVIDGTHPLLGGAPLEGLTPLPDYRGGCVYEVSDAEATRLTGLGWGAFLGGDVDGYGRRAYGADEYGEDDRPAGGV